MMNEASKTSTRQRVLVGTSIAILGVYGLLSFMDAREASRRLALAHDDLIEVKQKLAEIELLSTAPSVAALETESPGAINARIDSALEKTGASKRKSEPGVANQLQGTQYKAQKTEIELLPTTLLQIVEFCESLQEEDTGSVVSGMQLTIPTPGEASAGPEVWKASLTLTQTIYSPKSE